MRGIPRDSISFGIFLCLAASGCDCSDDPPAGLDASLADGATDSGAIADVGPGSSCLSTGASCDRNSGGTCCSGVCGVDDRCNEAAFCRAPSESCTVGTECCTGSCVGGRCGAVLCRGAGQVCSSGGECCSNLCGANGACEVVPAGPGGDSCSTLGEVCTNTGTIAGGDCCSTNCQGGVCVRAYSCQANGDVCFRDADCCGNFCSQNDGQPGRCQFITGGGGGGCIQGGNPCPNGGTNCCSRICVDLGTGAAVCQVAGGCVLTGEFCASDQECCGGGTNPNGSVDCNSAPRGRCDNGQSCNPVGNICGAPVLPGGGSINASQNCCDGKKEVCKLDSSGIPRCFGGCPGGNCSPTCPSGYDPDVTECCIAEGEACQFRDQCCNRAPCVPGPTGSLVCGAPPQCLVLGATCTPPADAGTDPCCSGTVCRQTAQVGTFACQQDFGPPDPGGPGADAGFDDAGRPIDAGVPVDAGPQCAANGGHCSVGGDCCSGICSAGRCETPQVCQPGGSVCTASGDCCQGLSCELTPGSTTGLCVSGSVCANVGQACGPSNDCCSGLSCSTLGGSSACDGTTACACTVQF